MATFPSLHATNWAPLLQQAIVDTVTEQISAVAGAGNNYSDADAQDAIASMIVGGQHPGMTITRNTTTNKLDIRPTTPVLVLAAGAAVPAGTAVGTIIVRS